MKTLLPLILLLALCAEVHAAPPVLLGNRFTTNVDGTPINGNTLKNLNANNLTLPVTNIVYDATVGYSSGFTTTHNAAGQAINISAYNSKQWFVKQTTPLILTNSVTPAAYWFWSTNNFDEGAPCWSFYTNLDVSADYWAHMTGPDNFDLTNGIAVDFTTSWLDGQAGTLPDNIFQFKTNTTVSTTSADNYWVKGLNGKGTNTTFSGGGVPYFTITNGYAAASVAGDLFFNFYTPASASGGIVQFNFGSAFGQNDYGSININTKHGGGNPDPTTTEMVLSCNRIALAYSGALQIGGGFGSADAAAFAYMFPHPYLAFTTSVTNHSAPLMFQTFDRPDGSTPRVHHPSIFSANVTTNGVGTWYLGLGTHQSADFDAQGTTPFFPSITNLSVLLWGGGSNTVEVLFPAQFDSSISAPSNAAPFNVLTVTNFVVGTRYVNGPTRAFVSASITLTPGVTGLAACSLYIENNKTNRMIISQNNLATETLSEQLFGPVSPGAVFVFADESAGGGTISIVGGSCSLTRD